MPQLEVDIIGLSAPDVVGTLAGENEIRTEFAVAHLGIDLSNGEAEIGALPLERGGEARPHPVDVMLVDHRLDLVVGKVVDLADHLSRRNVLAEDDIQQSQLAVDLRAHVEVLLALVDQDDVAAHVGEADLHLLHLYGARDGVLSQPLDDEVELLRRQFVILFCLQEILAGDQLFLIEFLLLVVGTAGTGHLHVELRFLELVVELVLLHRHLRVAEEVLLLGQLRLGVEYLQIEARVGEADDDIAFLHLRALLDDPLTDDTALLGAELDDRNRLYLAVDPHEVVELVFSDVANAQSAGIDLECRGVIAKNDPSDKDDEQRATGDVGDMLLLKSFLFL